MSIRFEQTDIASLSADAIVVEQGAVPVHAAARTVIQVNAPPWLNGKRGQMEKLERRYQKGLNEVQKKELHSVGFPLLSVASQGFPPKKGWSAALRACLKWEEQNPDYEIDIAFAVSDERLLKQGQEKLAALQEQRERNQAWNHAFQMMSDSLRSHALLNGFDPTDLPGSNVPPRDENGMELPYCPATESAIQLIHRYNLGDASNVGTAILRDLERNCTIFVAIKLLVEPDSIPIVQTPKGPLHTLVEGVNFEYWIEDTDYGKCVMGYTSRDVLYTPPGTIAKNIRLEDFLALASPKKCDGIFLNYGEEGFYIATHSVLDLLDVFHGTYHGPN